MPGMLQDLGLVVAALCAGIMGFAIQRGATCAVAAVGEIVTQRRFSRLLALLEASVWVSGGLVVARALGFLPHSPSGYALNGWTILGGALLGLGAYVNRACVFGAIARFGSGEWAYRATPLGFYAGCLGFGALPGMGNLPLDQHGSPVLQAPAWVAA